MKRTSIEVDEEQARLLWWVSAVERRSLEDVVHEALDQYLTHHELAPKSRVIEPRCEMPEEEWQARWDSLLERIRSGVPSDMTSQEIEDMITAASEEVRQERMTRRQASRA